MNAFYHKAHVVAPHSRTITATFQSLRPKPEQPDIEPLADHFGNLHLPRIWMKRIEEVIPGMRNNCRGHPRQGRFR